VLILAIVVFGIQIPKTIKELRNKEITIHSNTSVAMINKHYQDMSDDNLVKIHNQLFPERTMYLKNKSITKKS